MKFGAFLIFPLLFTGYYVDARALHSIDEALEELNTAKEFLESTKTKIGNIEADGYEAENAKNTADYVAGILLEVIRLGPSKAIEIGVKLSQIEELINEASEFEASDDLKEVLKKVEKAEDVIRQTKDQQQATVLQHIEYMVDIVNDIKTKVEANPDSLLEQFKMTEELTQKLYAVPKYLSNLIKRNYYDIIEQLWNVDLAIDSVKTAYPSETAELKEILRATEDAFYTLRRETKKLTMEVALTKAAFIFPEDSILQSLNELKESDTTLDTIALGEGTTITEGDDGLDGIKEKMIHLGDLLEGANPSFLKSFDDVVEQIMAKYPEDYQQLPSLVDEVKVAVSELKKGVKTVVDKIKLDASEGVKTDCLYTEMFARVLKDKLNVLTKNGEQIGQIFEIILPQLPDGNELKTTIEKFEEMMGDMGEFGEFLRESSETFYVFLVGGDEIEILDQFDVSGL